jgi:cyclopropane fatty-acyl-phospholipid synthase-like methyltransferase
MIHGIVQAWIDEGISPNTALRLAPFALIEDELGVEALHRLGLNERTLRRWRAEIRAQRDAHLAG